MIGLFGIISKCIDELESIKRFASFSGMHAEIRLEDFAVEKVSGNNCTIGIVSRQLGENNDLTLKKISENFIISFCGYGKFGGERKLFWAKDIVNRIIDVPQFNDSSYLTKLEGSFICLIYKKGELTIISDRFGSKEFYYYDAPNLIVFASSVDQIMASNLVPKKKNLAAASHLLMSNFFLGDQTLAENVFRFPYASIMRKDVNEGSEANFIRYWNISETEGKIDYISPDLINIFELKMQQAVFELLDLEPRAITGLSGGLDSRAIACFVARRQKVKAISYGQEISLALKTAKKLNAELISLPDKKFRQISFKENLKKEITASRGHSIVNQYFITPLFQSFFKDHQGIKALFDGIYLDILFSAPYVYHQFDFNQFIKTYFRGSGIVVTKFSKLTKEDVDNIQNNKFIELLTGVEHFDGVGQSEAFYLKGRLRRYVIESPNSRENYCYVLKPGFNYELADFAYRLNLRLRKGLLYTRMLSDNFPHVMEVKYKDSYGNRKKTMAEKISSQYFNFRHRLSSVTSGRVKYLTNEADVFFLGQNGIDEYRDIFFGQNYISELFNDKQLENLFCSTKKKAWLFNMFQSVLLIQQFYAKNHF